MAPNLPEFKKSLDAFGDMVGFLGLSCGGPEAGLNGLSGYFSAQVIL